MSFEVRFCGRRIKDRTGAGRQVYPKYANNMDVSGLSFRRPQLWDVFL